VWFGERKDLVTHGVNVATYALLDEPGDTYDEIAADMGVSRGRVGQLVLGGLRLLRERARYEGRELTVTVVPEPRKLEAWRRRIHDLPARAAREHERDRALPWVELPAPMAVRALLPRIGALLERLGLSPGVTTAEPSLRTWADRGVQAGEARWEDGGLRVVLTRSGHVRARHEGGEAAALWLGAEISGLPGGARLVLEGRIGHLEAFAVEGDSTGAIETIWRESSGLGARPNKRRKAERRSDESRLASVGGREPSRRSRRLWT
jgi:hypothetical protein